MFERLKLKTWLMLVGLWAARLVRQPTIPVRVEGGWIRGEIASDGSHIRYLGVPYATYTDRFQGPVAVKPWEGILEAFEENIRCLQRFSPNWITGQEDCLTLNVYTPVTISDKLRPVMVFIHGGGFRDGSSSPFIYGPDYLVRHDVILVTINYRLEILGFLCLGTQEAPGNTGLKDQAAALKWVNRNIAAFGGDPKHITLFGESAGSASVLYHIISPMSKGLFHRAILQSGSAISPWSFQFEPLKTASSFVKQMGHITLDPHKIYEVIKTKTSTQLLKTRVPRKVGDVVLSENIFVPCVEKKLPGVDRFLSDTPYNLITKGQFNKVPVIIGYNSFEGYMFVGKENATTLSNFNFYDSLPRDIFFPSDVDKIKTSRKLQELYVGDKEINKNAIKEISKYEGDSGIVFPVILTTNLLISNMEHPVYVYKFSHDGWLNFIKFIFKFWKYPGATHADDIFYIFKFKFTLLFHFLEAGMVERISIMWSNFAKYENPTPEVTDLLPQKWQPTDKNDPKIFIIDKEFSTEYLWEDKDIRFWNETYTKYRRIT